MGRRRIKSRVVQVQQCEISWYREFLDLSRILPPFTPTPTGTEDLFRATMYKCMCTMHRANIFKLSAQNRSSFQKDILILPAFLSHQDARLRHIHDHVTVEVPLNLAVAKASQFGEEERRSTT